VLGPVAYFIRYRLPETPAFVRTDPAKRPITETYRTSVRRVMVAIGTVACATVTAYTTVFMPSFAIRILHLPISSSFAVAAAATLPQLVLVPLFGALSDRVGRIRVMLPSAVTLVPASLGLFWWLTASPSLERLLVVQVVLGVTLAAYCGGLAAFVTEVFATRVRTTGTSLCYALSVTMFGGFAPFINAALIEITGSQMAPSFYLAASAVVSIAALRAARRLGCTETGP
jgi:MHS family proline/betaine transporter-like MFS transporter